MIASPLLFDHLLTGCLVVHHCDFCRVSIESACSFGHPTSLEGSWPTLSLVLLARMTNAPSSCLLMAVSRRTSTPSLEVISGRSIKRRQKIIIFLVNVVIVIIVILLLVSTSMAHELLLL